jgi:hypothetical protein
MPWLSLFVLRLLMGERFRKATPAELRFYSGFFAFTPIWLLLFAYFLHSYLDHAGAVGIFGYLMLFLIGFCLWLAMWAKFVSSNVSWWLGGFVWAVTLWLAFTNQLG